MDTDALYILCIRLDEADTRSLLVSCSLFTRIIAPILKMQSFWKQKIEFLIKQEDIPNLGGCLKKAYSYLANKKPTSALLTTKMHQLYLEPKFCIGSLIEASIDGHLDIVEFMLNEKLIVPSSEEQYTLFDRFENIPQAAIYCGMFALDLI